MDKEMQGEHEGPTLSRQHSEMVKENPFLLLRYPPYDKMTNEEWMTHRDLVRKQLVATYCTSPLYQKEARESGDEARYWSNFSVGGIVHLNKEKTKPFTLDELRGMSIMEIVTEARALKTAE